MPRDFQRSHAMSTDFKLLDFEMYSKFNNSEIFFKNKSLLRKEKEIIKRKEKKINKR